MNPQPPGERFRPPPPQRPTTPWVQLEDTPEYKALQRRYAQVGRTPPDHVVEEMRRELERSQEKERKKEEKRFRRQRRRLGSSSLPLLVEGKVSYSPRANAMLWDKFKKHEFVWTTEGKTRFAAEAEVDAEHVKSEVQELTGQDESDEKRGAILNAILAQLDSELKEVLTEFIGLKAAEDEMATFMLDIGFSPPVLNTIKAAGMAAKHGAKAASTWWQKRNVKKFSESMKNLDEMQEMPLFNLGAGGLITTLSQDMKFEFVNFGTYVFDLIPLPIPGQVTAFGRMVWKYRRLFKTWKATKKVNIALAQDKAPDMRRLIFDNPVLGYQIFDMHNMVLTGIFSDLDVQNLSPQERYSKLQERGAIPEGYTVEQLKPSLDNFTLENRQIVLELLGFDLKKMQEQAQILDKLRFRAAKLKANAPYLLVSSLSRPTDSPSGNEPKDALTRRRR